jgi:hypothetical protein
MERLPGLNDVPPAPRSPSPEARHLVFGYRGSQGVGFTVGGLLLVFGMLFALIFGWGLPADLAIDLARREATGTLLSAERNANLRVNGRRPTRIQFEFQAGDRRWEASANSFQVRPGQTGPVPVQYSAMRPGWARVAGDTVGLFGYFGLLALAIPGLGGVMLARSIRSNRREIRAFTHGVPALARVTFRGRDTTVRVNGQSPFLMRWEFQAPGGVFQGSISSMRLLDIKAFGDAGQVVVLYDPQDPACNTLFVP